MDGLCISGTKGAAYSQSLTKGTASLLSGTNRWTASVLVGQRGRPIPKVLPKGRHLCQLGQQMDGLCISRTKGAAYSKSLTKGTASLPSGTSRWTASVSVGQRGRPIPKVLPKGRPLCFIEPRGRPLRKAFLLSGTQLTASVLRRTGTRPLLRGTKRTGEEDQVD